MKSHLSALEVMLPIRSLFFRKQKTLTSGIHQCHMLSVMSGENRSSETLGVLMEMLELPATLAAIPDRELDAVRDAVFLAR